MDDRYRDGRVRARRGSGSVRQRRPGVREIRVVVANDPVTGRSMQRSFTVHGHSELFEARRRELVGRFGVDRRALYCEGAAGLSPNCSSGSSRPTFTGDPRLDPRTPRWHDS
jgi:hypothetical protein